MRRAAPAGDLSRDEARRIALGAQGFDRPRPRGRVDARHVEAVIRRIGLLQVDFVNVLVPSHYFVPFSRLGPYDRSGLDRVVYARRRFTEQWAHEASIVPVEHWPLFRHRRATFRIRPWGFEQFLERQRDYAEWVLDAVRARGPLTADDLPDPPSGVRCMTDRWGWGAGVRRSVLEAFFARGRLAVTERLPNFMRKYDLAERVISRQHLEREVGQPEADRLLLLEAARAHGVATVGDLADYYRMSPRAARPRVTELVEAGRLREVRVEGWREPAVLDPGVRAPPSVQAVSLLSPFDPLVWTRKRVRRLFDFDYRLEIFVPEAKRRWGYYVLPFLLGDRLVARVDLKADRAAGRLRVKAAYLEAHADARDVAAPLVEELRLLAAWLELEEVTVGRKGGFARALASEVRA